MIEALITRPPEDAARLERQLKARSINCFIEPMLQIRFPEERLKMLKAHLETRPQAILITSANGVRALARTTGERGFFLLTVGDQSAQEALQLGFSHVISASGTVETLAEKVAMSCHPARGMLLHITGNATAGDLPGDLAARGFQVERCIAYESSATNTLSEGFCQQLSQKPFDLAFFYSPRSAAIFAALLTQKRLTAVFQKTQALVLSGAVERELSSIPFHAVYCTAEPTGASMLALIDKIYGCTITAHHG